MVSIDLLVLRCLDVDVTRSFYEHIGVEFTREKHGSGPEHYATQLGSILIELYPATGSRQPEVGLRIGLAVDDANATAKMLEAAGYTPRGAKNETSLVDPDGRVVTLVSRH